MADTMPPPNTKSASAGWIAAGTAGVIAVGTVAAILRPAVLPEAPVASSPPAAPPSTVSPIPQPSGSATGPRFDVVRISPRGEAVIAGRAAPGAEVTVREGNQIIGRARAGPDGTWVVTPASPLLPGAGALTVAGPDGKAGPDSVLVSIPKADHPAAPLAVLTAPSQAPRVLQMPAGSQGNRLALQALDYGRSGQMQFSGRAPPGAKIELYVDNKVIGQAVSAPDGSWTLAAASPVPPGMHRLRIDQLGAGARVVARIELPFNREAVPDTGLASGGVIVQPGQSLWRIARATYGQGIRYTVIYVANLGKIRDPNLIYPGQVFAIPLKR